MIVLDYKDRRPIYEQIMERFQELMVRGILKAHEAMPSVRSLATELSINPNTIQRAYTELERQGYIYTVKGRGSFVSDYSGIRDRKRQEIWKDLRRLVNDARYVGISEETFLSQTSGLYQEGGERDDRGNEPDKTI